MIYIFLKENLLVFKLYCKNPQWRNLVIERTHPPKKRCVCNDEKLADLRIQYVAFM